MIRQQFKAPLEKVSATEAKAIKAKDSRLKDPVANTRREIGNSFGERRT